MHTSSSHRQPTIPFVDLTAPYVQIRDEIDAAIDRILTTGDFILGHDVECFEQEFAQYCECAYGVGVDSGTSGLELALRAYGVGAGDEVIVPANTFIATALAVSCTGATPVLVDIDPATYTIDVARLGDAITDRTKAIIPVHLYGQPADLDPVLEIARERGLVVIEDACQAHGARYKGRRIGSLGHAAAFSFYPSKNLGACGDGGMVVTNDGDVARSMQLLRNYGQTKKYHHQVCGYNRRLDNLQAALLRIKLKYLDTWNDARRDRAEAYSRVLRDAVHVPVPAYYSDPVWHLYVIEINEADRDGLQAHLAEHGISTGIHYPIPIHLQPAYRQLGYQSGDFPITEQVARRILSLPMYPELSLNAIEKIGDVVRGFLTPLPILEKAV
jgi:dTDP-4-amino-4,6-dideoxygalactose transaminase